MSSVLPESIVVDRVVASQSQWPTLNNGPKFQCNKYLENRREELEIQYFLN